MTEPAEPPECRHLRVIPDGVRLERKHEADGVRRYLFELATCRDCRHRVQRSWQIRHPGQWHEKPADVARARDLA